VGVLHGDVRLPNFVAGAGGDPVKIVDFERSTLFTPGDADAQLAAEEELARVDEL
jgi:aminoglycoside phosphotransferase (APT) family kinase protein